LFPNAHRIALNETVAVFTRYASLRQRQKHALGVNQTAELIEVLHHVVWIDHQLFNHASQTVDGKVESDCCVWANRALNGRVRNVTLMPESNILKRRNDRHTYETCKASQVLSQNWIALMRHCGRALLARREEFFCFQNFCALHMAD